MAFLEHPEDYGLDPSLGSMGEWKQDSYLREKAWSFAREQPGRVLSLAATKLGRFWSPMPNASEWSSLPMRLISLAGSLPIFVLATVGAWRLRRRVAVLLVLAGPVLYFSLIHMVFVSSIRYREAAMLPVLGLAAAALVPRQSITQVSTGEEVGNGRASSRSV